MQGLVQRIIVDGRKVGATPVRGKWPRLRGLGFRAWGPKFGV